MQQHEDQLPLAGDRRKAVLELHARDKGLCWLCGDAVDIGIVLRMVHPGSPVADHVDPKSAGGLLVWGNVRLAHRQCNALRSNYPPETFSREEYRESLRDKTFIYEHPHAYWSGRWAEAQVEIGRLRAAKRGLHRELADLEHTNCRVDWPRMLSIAAELDAVGSDLRVELSWRSHVKATLTVLEQAAGPTGLDQENR